LIQEPARPFIAAVVAVVVAAVAIAAAPVFAHDIPQDVTVHAFVRPEGDRLHAAVRVPLRSILEVEYPRREQDYLDLERIGPALEEAAEGWVVNNLEIRENGVPLAAPRIVAVRLALESDRSFATYGEAVASFSRPPLPASTTLFWEQGLLDVLLEYRRRADSDDSDLAVRAGFDRLGLTVVTVLHYVSPEGPVRVYRLPGDAGLVRLDPRWHHAAARFVALGFDHILAGADHLLFLLCLVVPLRKFRALVPVVTAFTIAHSVTLIASAYGIAPGSLWFPPLVEALIALSIIYMALENIVARRFEWRWAMAFVFGLVHGFGFSFLLTESLQFAGSHLVTSLLAFNVGVELGQLAVLAVLVPALAVAFRLGVPERTGTIILSALVAHTAWHWMEERAAVVGEFPLGWPDMDPAGLAALLRLGMIVIAAGALVWFIFGRRDRAAAAGPAGHHVEPPRARS
jgi:hypothetical protein